MSQKKSPRAARRVAARLSTAGLVIQTATALIPATARAADEPVTLGEVVVTANRRAETVSEVPINIQAIPATTLQEIGARDLRDFMRMVPGLSFEEGGPRDGTNLIVLRGLTGDYGSNSTTSTYVDDTEVSALDLKLLDIDRVEVLRGPQGTLYGGGAIGGVIRYISAQPSLTETEQRVSAGISNTAHGGTNYEANGLINMPLVDDKLALRATAGYYDNDGYIDNVQLHRDNVNYDKTIASRVALLYAPTEAFRATLSYYRQDVRYGTSSTIPRLLGKYNIDDNFSESTEGHENLANLTLNFDLGPAVLTSSTSYTNRDRQDVNDDTYYVRNNYGNPDLLALTDVWTDGDGTTEELRLVSKPGKTFDWIAGAYWTRTSRHMGLQERIPIPFPGQSDIEEATGNTITDDREVRYDDSSSARQTALFGELRYHVTDKWQLTAGGRYYDYELRGATFFIDQYYGVDARDANGKARLVPFEDEIQRGRADSNGSVWKLNTSYELGAGNLLYVTVAEGFRPGGFNTDQNATGSRHQYEPDSIVSYEVGDKLTFAQGKGYLSTAVYYIDWSDMQTYKYDTTENDVFYAYITNAGKARSQGIELELGTRDLLVNGLSLLMSYAFTDMELRETIDELGFKGDHAPLVPRNAGSFMADYSFALPSGHRLGFNFASTYTGRSFNSFGADYPSGGEIVHGTNRMKHPYWLTGVSARLQSERWTTRLFVDNLFDKDADISVGTGLAGGGLGTRGPSRAIERPRTIGINLSYQF
ncbi:MAG: TonB-dependent receptor [Gammaproteobacteria bacterium]